MRIPNRIDEDLNMNFRRSLSGKVYTIESMVVTEKEMAKFYGVPQLKIYVPTLINVVSIADVHLK